MCARVTSQSPAFTRNVNKVLEGDDPFKFYTFVDIFFLMTNLYIKKEEFNIYIYIKKVLGAVQHLKDVRESLTTVM